MATNKHPTDLAFSDDETLGFKAFWEGLFLNSLENISQRRGWWYAHRRAYGEGVKASIQCGDGYARSPYAEFTPASNAWSDGYNEEFGLNNLALVG